MTVEHRCAHRTTLPTLTGTLGAVVKRHRGPVHGDDVAPSRRPAGVERVPGLRFLGPGTQGRRLDRITRLILAFTIVAANLGGAAVVFALAAWVIPSEPVANSHRIVLLNVVLTGGYLVVAIPLGIVFGGAAIRETRRWLRAEDVPDERQARLALRGPIRLTYVQGVLWSIAVAFFTLVNGILRPRITFRVFATVSLGGLTVCAITYLLAERVTRPIAARALAAGHGFPKVPGVTKRTMLAWALGTGIPVVGLVITAVGALVLGHTNVTQLEVSMLVLGSTALVVGGGVILLGARAVADPVRSVRVALKRVEEGDFEVEIPVYDASELGQLQAGVNLMAAGLREREQLRDLFGRHVGEDVARDALQRGVALGGETCNVAVLFVDLVGSTELATSMPPSDVVSLLNRFFGVVIRVVDEHGGSINKFAGDAALAVFGAPAPVDDHAGHALAAGRELAKRLPVEVPELDAGIGVAAGVVVAGNLGDRRRFEYTVIGDPVNVAARLTELAKSEPGRVLATADAVALANPEEAALWAGSEQLTLRGRALAVAVARPLAHGTAAP